MVEAHDDQRAPCTPHGGVLLSMVRVPVGTGVLGRVLEGGVIEGAWKVLRRQKHALSQGTTPFACTQGRAFRPKNVHVQDKRNLHGGSVLEESQRQDKTHVEIRS